jgi:hypothetical protein
LWPQRTSTINGLDALNVSVADVSGAYTANGASHVWCNPDPWSYGLSLFHIYDPDSFDSQAPFHPTPDGQASIAEHVIPAVTTTFGYDTPPGLTTTTR